MAIKTPAAIKAAFETGKSPAYQDFVDLVDSRLDVLLSNFPNPLPAVDGSQLLNIGAALPDPLPARSGALLTNINPQEYNLPSGMPVPSYATATSFVLLDDWTVTASDPAKRVFLLNRRLRLTIAGNYHYNDVLNATFAAGSTTVTLAANMPGSPIQACEVGVIKPFALGGAVSPRLIGISAYFQTLIGSADLAGLLAGASLTGALRKIGEYTNSSTSGTALFAGLSGNSICAEVNLGDVLAGDLLLVNGQFSFTKGATAGASAIHITDYWGSTPQVRAYDFGSIQTITEKRSHTNGETSTFNITCGLFKVTVGGSGLSLSLLGESYGSNSTTTVSGNMSAIHLRPAA